MSKGLSDEHRAKISASMIGKKNSLGRHPSEETCQRISAGLLGNKNALGYRHTKKAKRRISEALLGRPVSDETKRRLSEALRNLSDETRQRLSEVMRNNKNSLGHKNALGYRHTKEAKRRISKASRRHLESTEPCGCGLHIRLFRQQPSKLAWKAYDRLLQDFEIVIPEARFGRHSVDFLLAEEWLGIEIDGEYWHKGQEDRDATRDAELLARFNLPIVRLTEEDLLSDQPVAEHATNT